MDSDAGKLQMLRLLYTIENMLVKWSKTQFTPTWGETDHIIDQEKSI
jgi:hypothetical protein